MKPQDYLVSDTDAIENVLRNMDNKKIKYAIVHNSEDSVVGTITDGDIRRGVINGINLSSPVHRIMNRGFVSLRDTDDFEKILQIFRDRKIDFIPILNEKGNLKNIMTRHVLNAILLMNEKTTLDFDFDKLSQTVLEHEIFVRPWGYYKTMVLSESFQSKIIYVLPKQCLSLQSHSMRDEHWTIISGHGRVQIDDDIFPTVPGKAFHIPRGHKHRMFNDSDDEVLIYTEIQLGDYFGEDDIVRYEDRYGRADSSEQ